MAQWLRAAVRPRQRTVHRREAWQHHVHLLRQARPPASSGGRQRRAEKLAVEGIAGRESQPAARTSAPRKRGGRTASPSGGLSEPSAPALGRGATAQGEPRHRSGGAAAVVRVVESLRLETRWGRWVVGGVGGLADPGPPAQAGQPERPSEGMSGRRQQQQVRCDEMRGHGPARNAVAPCAGLSAPQPPGWGRCRRLDGQYVVSRPTHEWYQSVSNVLASC